MGIDWVVEHCVILASSNERWFPPPAVILIAWPSDNS